MKNDMHLDFCTFEECRQLKEKGFAVPTDRYYTGDGTLITNFEESFGESEYRFEAIDFFEDWNQRGWIVDKKGGRCFGCRLDNQHYFEGFSAPTRAVAFEWIRVNFNLCPEANSTVADLLAKI